MLSTEFNTEEELVRATIACTRRARSRKYRVELEVDAGVGIADLLLVKRSEKSTASLKSLASITPRLAVLLSPEVGLNISSIEDLVKCLGTTPDNAKRLFYKLREVDVLHGTPNKFFIHTIKLLPFQRVIAVEAKISEWQRVLMQAYRNLQFADESWVVLDYTYIRPALAQLDRFRKSGVGLASVRKGHGLFIHSPACAVGATAVGKFWQAQAVLAARVEARRMQLEI